MTQAERLIRNLCDGARTAVARDTEAALQASDAGIPPAALPARVRGALAMLRHARAKAARAAAVIKAAGYDVPEEGDDLTQLHKPYRVRSAEKTAARAQERLRQQQIAALQNAAIVASLGKFGAAAAPILQTLQADLAKV